MSRTWRLILLSGLGWPLAHYAIAAARFGADNAGTGWLQALLDFGLFGLAAGAIYVFFRNRVVSDRQANLMKLGYFAAMPFAFIGSLSGGLILAGPVGALVMGGLPLLIGAGLGSLLGGLSGAG